MFEIDLHETDLFQMALFEIDALEIVSVDNTQKMIEVDYYKSLVQSFSQISQDVREIKL